MIEPDDEIVTVALTAYFDSELNVHHYGARRRMADALNAVRAWEADNYELPTVVVPPPTDTVRSETGESSRSSNPLNRVERCEKSGYSKSTYILALRFGKSYPVIKCPVCPFDGGCSR